MRKFVTVICIALVICADACAVSEDFYIVSINPPEKLIPNTLRATIYENQSATFRVDLLPADSNAEEIVWELLPDIGDISCKGRECTLNAHKKGNAILYAYEKGGAHCQIKIEVMPRTQKITIDGEDNISIGEKAIFYARTEPECDVSWEIEGKQYVAVSYGGDICRIFAEDEGEIKITAITEDGAKAQKILEIKGGREEVHIGLLAIYLAVGATVILAICIYFYRRLKNEKQM